MWVLFDLGVLFSVRVCVCVSFVSGKGTMCMSCSSCFSFFLGWPLTFCCWMFMCVRGGLHPVCVCVVGVMLVCSY